MGSYLNNELVKTLRICAQRAICKLEEERAQISGYQVAGCATRTACHEDDAHGKGRRQSERHCHCKTEKRHDGVLAGEAKKHLLARYTRDAMKILIRDGG